MSTDRTAYQKAYDSRPEVKARKRVQSRERYANHPEVKRARSIAWSKAHPDKAVERHRKWAENNQAHLKTWQKEYREKNRDHINKVKAERDRERYHNDPEYHAKRLHQGHVRRARTVHSASNPTAIRDFIKSVKSKPTAICYYCQERVCTKDVHFDHIIPLSKGGPHSVENLCVSCSYCNYSKNNKLLRDFVALGQQLLSL
jgi:5-methylcytosine-specific restriction endonuclease McrA